MNLFKGTLVDAKQMPSLLRRLPEELAATLNKPLLDVQLVIDACDRLASRLPEETVLPVLQSLGIGTQQAKAQLAALRVMFSREYLAERLRVELGQSYPAPSTRKPPDLATGVTERVHPLGVLFHIAAGNMDGLPVYSVIEGLLAGNINLLKLPAVDGGLSVMVLQMLVEIEPRLAEYIYVFELSSSETGSMQQLATLADAIVVWGGDEAVQAVRRMAQPNTRVIEWGHKLSFAYVTQQGMTQPKLEALAHGICATNQLLCSSCQGIFIDTNSAADALAFCGQFLPILEKVSASYPPVPLAASAQATLQLYNRELEATYGFTGQIFRGNGVSLTFETDKSLAPSLQFRNPWVRCLPADEIVSVLHPYKNHLQTAALLCGTKEWTPLRDKLWRAGLVRISDGAQMTDSYCGAAHDGDYPLRRYTRVVSAQK